jgi:radical SAM superfamily enzyme YgiQ (UPF0313 family)
MFYSSQHGNVQFQQPSRRDVMPIDILLVNPVFLSQNEAERDVMSPYFPIGLLYLVAFLRDRGFQVDIFDGTFLDGPADFTRALKEHKPGTVGISVVQPNREMALTLAEIAQGYGATVIFGGPDPTLRPEKYLSLPEVDYVVHHEGELTLVALLEYLTGDFSKTQNLADIEGIAYREENGEIKITPRRPYILNLDELPQPARDMIDMDQYLQVWREENGYASLTISISRGCPYNCQWCQDSVHGADFRQRSPESVAAEVKSLMQAYNIDRLRLVDDVDGIDKEWIEAWAQCAEDEGAVLPFEALYNVKRTDVPMLDIRDSL